MIGPLPLPRHEVFAQAVASGMSVRKATHSRIPAPKWSDTSIRGEAAHKC